MVASTLSYAIRAVLVVLSYACHLDVIPDKMYDEMCACVRAGKGTYSPVTRTESPVLHLARSLNNTSLAEGTLDIIATFFALTKAFQSQIKYFS